MRKLTDKATWHLRANGLIIKAKAHKYGVGAKHNYTSGRAPGRMEGKHQHQHKIDQSETIEAVVFVPYTPGWRLQGMLQRAEDKAARLNNTPRWKFVENSGQKLKDILTKSDPWGSRECIREECWPCQSEDSRGKQI